MNNGINFSMDGPMIEGTWQNMQTGDYFTVRDSYFQDGELMVQATDGRMFTYNILQNYIKVDSPVKIDKPKSKQKQLPQSLENELEEGALDLLPEDTDLINGAITESATPRPELVLPLAQPVEDEDTKMIKRVLDRANKDPEITTTINWSSYPDKQMEMLVDYMGVDIEKVVDYYIDKIDLNVLRNKLKNDIKSFIENHIGDFEPLDEKPKTTKK